MYNTLIYDQSNSDRKTVINIDNKMKNQGLGPLLILLITFKLLNERKIDLTDLVEITDTAVKEKGKGIVGYTLDDNVILLQVLENFKVTSGTDSLFLLSNHIYVKTQKKVSQYFKEILLEKNIPENFAINISGKANTRYKQNYDLNAILSIMEDVVKFNSLYINILSLSKVVYKQKIYYSETFLLDKGIVTYNFSFLSISIFVLKNNDFFKFVIVDSVNNIFHLDSIVERLLENRKKVVKKNDIKFFEKNMILNIIGDTYFGEYYSKRREKRGGFDPLINEGYYYSFKKINNFLAEADFNIVNFEACLINDNIISPLVGLKKFILGADAEPTINSLISSHIHCLSLANNHTADYGVAGVINTINVLDNKEMDYVGVGLNEYEACKPIRINVNSKKISIYAGYWYRSTNHKIFNFYATPSKPGVATLESLLLESIVNEKKENPENFIIVIAHWGIDFLSVQPYQKKLAHTLVKNGADLIIGHGAHTLQDIMDIDNTTVIYGIGNGIFNSDGEFDGYPDALPYGMITQLVYDNNTLKLRLYPIHANNRKTLWQPDFLELQEFEVVNKFYQYYKFDRINLKSKPYFFEKKLL